MVIPQAPKSNKKKNKKKTYELYVKIDIARNKPADGSSHLKQREKTPTPGHKGGQSTKQQAHSAKQLPPGKHGSISVSKQGSLQKTPSSNDGMVIPQAPKSNKKKNKKKTYELYVKIDIVSKNFSAF
ncbi:hypothetical protein PVAND_012970 [Polypedilum vanderplanki]|uniref:Uncharacterized protein n=1 Tax=Polypedilum vanderplanki TaxID=319348 RepID=A0A9J6CP20_POLVA|nr:hypothetical protein PVAND_012970 [Polypedilum vanderplanki]